MARSRRLADRRAAAGLPGDAAASAREWVQRRRRPLAAASAAAAALMLAVRAAPPEVPTVEVIAAARDLPAGALLQADDLARASVPGASPGDAVAAPSQAVGRVLAVPLAAGQPLAPTDLVGPGALSVQARAAGHSLVAVPVRLADAGVAALLQPGDTVDVWATPSGALAVGEDASGIREAQRVGEALQVLAVPRPARGGGLLAGSDPAAPTGGLVVLAVPTASVARLVRAAADRLAVAVRPDAVVNASRAPS